jgi:hypothetical protein
MGSDWSIRQLKEMEMMDCHLLITSRRTDKGCDKKGKKVSISGFKLIVSGLFNFANYLHNFAQFETSIVLVFFFRTL